MQEELVDELDFTHYATEVLYDVVDDVKFQDNDCYLIYDGLRKHLKAISFSDYLKRYIYQKAGLCGDYKEIPLKEYKQIIKDAFKDNVTPPAFTPTTAKLSALAQNWLTQQTVNRKVVFLLGFGLRMSVEDVNDFLTKVLCEQRINSKNPFEVICWYCYKNHYSYPKFEKLWQIYEETMPGSLNMQLLYDDYTIDVHSRMHIIHDDAALIAYLSKLKNKENVSHFSVTAKKYFDCLYDEARDLVANAYNQLNGANEGEQHYVEREDISAGDMERMICSAVPVDRHGNLSPGKNSQLYQLFMGKRFSRQRIHEILTSSTEIDRFDLITLKFFIYAQKVEQYPNPKSRYIQFWDDMNQVLEECSMGKLYVANPYECFVLMCILAVDPMGTYADVWELSYSEET